MKRKEHIYKIGEIIKGIKILERKFHFKNNGQKEKSYKALNLEYNIEIEIREWVLKNSKSKSVLPGQYRKYVKSIKSKRPDLLKFLVNEISQYKPIGSPDKIEVKCPNDNCGFRKTMTVSKLVNRGFRCSYCSDGRSIGEKIIYKVLIDNDIDFETEKTFKNLKGNKGLLRSDFYCMSKNIIIEVQGAQHKKYSGIFSNENLLIYDNRKRDYFKSVNIELVEIDASKSEPTFIIESIRKTLPFLKINEDEILKYLSSSESNRWNYNDIIRMYQEGKTLTEIAERYNTNSTTISYILKRMGVYEKRKTRNTNGVRCITTGKEFHTLKEASQWCGKGGSHIGCACKGLRSYAGTLNGLPLKWEYL